MPSAMKTFRPRTGTADGPEAVTCALGLLVGQLDVGVDEVAGQVIAGLRAELGSAVDLDGAGGERVRQHVTTVVRAFALLVAERRRLSAEETMMVEAFAEQQAAGGVPQELMLDSARVAVRSGWRHLVHQAQALQTGPATVAALGQLALDTSDFLHDLSAGIARAYARHHGQSMTRRWRAQADLVTDLLSADGWPDEDLVARGRSLGHDLTGRHGLLLHAGFKGSTTIAVLRRAVLPLRARPPDALPSEVRTSPSAHAVTIVASSTASAWSAAVDAARAAAVELGIVVLAVDPVPGPAAIRHAYLDAVPLVQLAGDVSTSAGLVDSASLIVYRVLHAASTTDRRALLDSTLGPVLALPERQREAMLETLAATINSGTLREAGDALGIHPKTVRYRIQQAEALLGLRLDVPADRRRIDIALHFLQLVRH